MIDTDIQAFLSLSETQRRIASDYEQWIIETPRNKNVPAWKTEIKRLLSEADWYERRAHQAIEEKEYSNAA